MPGSAATRTIALIHKRADSGYGVFFLDIPGVIAVADSPDYALLEAGIALDFAFNGSQGGHP
jgi:predicted RNase H-like HicB family nuclease